MKKIYIIIGIVLVVLLVFGAGYLFCRNTTSWKDYSFDLNGKHVATVYYPDKYKDVSDNANLPDQKIGLFSIPNVINFQLSNEAKDKDINSLVEEIKKNNPPVTNELGEETETFDTNYKTLKYGLNTVYFINALNAPDYVVGEMFDGSGHHLSFTYRTKDVKTKEIESLISKIKF